MCSCGNIGCGSSPPLSRENGPLSTIIGFESENSGMGGKMMGVMIVMMILRAPVVKMMIMMMILNYDKNDDNEDDTK